MSVSHLPEPSGGRVLVRTFRGQTYRMIGSYARERSDGSEATILSWESRCAECGDSFTITTPERSSKFEPSRRCQRHKRPGQRVRSMPS